jgi:hypothetical protein
MRSSDPRISLQEAVLAFLDWRGDAITFTEIVRFVPELGGNEPLRAAELSGLVYWPNLSPDGVLTFQTMLAAGTLELSQASALHYVLDGYTSRLPIANALRAYRSTRWYPVTIGMAPALRIERAASRPRSRRNMLL